MRIWSLHPKYLDAKGIVALWRETLLAKNVLEGKTRGYKNHPQLERFKKATNALHLINQYLTEVFYEAHLRGYHFNKDKIDWEFTPGKIEVTKGQLMFETKHFLQKLTKRDNARYQELKKINIFDVHPIFKLIDGEIEEWEKL